MIRSLHFLFIAAAFSWILAGCGSAAHESEKTAATHENETHTESPAAEAADTHAGEAALQLISFSKHFQQAFSIRTEPVQQRPIHQIVRCLGEVKSAGTREAEVVAPFAAMLLPDAERGIVRPGQQVRRGEHLAVLAPSAAQGGWDQLVGDYQLAKAEYDRVTRLSDEGALAPKRVLEARLDLSVKEARLRAALGGMEIGNLDSTGRLFHLRAPSGGIVTDTHLRFGQHVEAGEHLFNIVDPSKVWLEAQVPASEAEKLDGIKDAYFTISGSKTIHRTEDYGGRLITVGGLLDPATRRVPVIFEIDNPDNRFKPGSFVQICLRRGAAHQALTVPQSALLDEDGIPVAIVQVGAEDFRKAILTIGAKDETHVEVLAGLSEGEPVVTNGAYKVMLAAAKTGGGDAHAGHGH